MFVFGSWEASARNEWMRIATMHLSSPTAPIGSGRSDGAACARTLPGDATDRKVPERDSSESQASRRICPSQLRVFRRAGGWLFAIHRLPIFNWAFGQRLRMGHGDAKRLAAFWDHDPVTGVRCSGFGRLGARHPKGWTPSRGVTVVTANRGSPLIVAVVLAFVAAANLFAARPVAALFDQPGLATNTVQTRKLAAAATAGGYDVQTIDVTTLTNPTRLRPDAFDLLIVPDGQRLPATATDAFVNYLKQGGDLLAIGLPLWSDPSFWLGGKWISRREYEDALARQRPQRILADFERADLTGWKRSSNAPELPARYALDPDNGRRVLRVQVGQITGWETYASPVLTDPFPPGHTLTCFRAKGGPRTRQLALEWRERDGSRWIATVDLSTAWRDYALEPAAFKAWQPPAGRGVAGDHLRVQDAVQFTVGLAFSHTALDGPEHEYWFDGLGTAPNPFGDDTPPAALDVPRLESLSLGYQFFPLADVETVEWPEIGGGILAATDPLLTRAPLTEADISKWLGIHPRPRGVGFQQERPWRWQPLGVARSRAGDYRGAVGVFQVQLRPPFRGGLWAGFTPSSATLSSAASQPSWQALLRSMARGLFLAEGGTEFFTVFEGQPLKVGARVVNFGRQPRSGVEVRLRIGPSGQSALVYTRDWTVNVEPGGEVTVQDTWQPVAWPEGEHQVTVELTADNSVVDRLVHPLQAWRPRPAPEFIVARDGGLWLNGKPWRAHGVNYMPSSGIGLADNNYFEHWLGRGAYDPEVIDRDLRRIKAMNLNAVSAFIYHRSLDAQHLLDFLLRCQQLDLRVNLSLRPGTPMDLRWTEMKALIEHYRLAQNDTVFAYELAWEPSHYDEVYQRRQYTALWRDWVTRRYGSWTAAETAWGMSLRAENRPAATASDRAVEPATPPMRWLTTDGPWRRPVADYRAFLDELVGQRYAEARRLVKSIDPNHPVSFRMQLSGDPTHNTERLLPYDFRGLKDAVDLWEPEAYGRIGDWDRVKAGVFTVAYARLCDPAKPVVWAEMGYSVWDMTRMAPHPDKLSFAARYYRDFYRMLQMSGSDGVFFWWYPGGLRLNESSDYGIVNPDGTDRELTRVIRDSAQAFLNAPRPAQPDYEIEVDRDRDARGLVGIYLAAQEEFWRALDAGKRPGLRWRTPQARSTR